MTSKKQFKNIVAKVVCVFGVAVVMGGCVSPLPNKNVSMKNVTHKISTPWGTSELTAEEYNSSVVQDAKK
jgi:hypothetical protein